jgi:putative peptide zinc metalloprotease protein
MAERGVTSAASTPSASLVLVLPGGERVPIRHELTIGRGDDVDVQIKDQTVSRVHARITLANGTAMLEDANSRYGTLLAGKRLELPEPLLPGSEIRLGDARLQIEGDAPALAPVEDSRAPGATIRVPVGATQLGLRPPPASDGLDGGLRPRVRSGWSLKRLGADEGEHRHVLRDERSGAFLRMHEDDAALFDLLDGQRTVQELLVVAAETVGPAGPGRLVRLLAELGDRGLLDGVEAAPAVPRVSRGLSRLLRPRDRSFDWVPPICEQAYARFGRYLFSGLSATALALLALAGFGAFAYIVGARYGTPFVVAHRLLIGGAVFVIGRFALVATHELAHGMALRHYGRHVNRGGVRLLLIFPYAFVDTSEAYFEPRVNRIVISAAGPISDVSLGAVFAFLCAASPAGSVRDVFFQLAFGAYVGAVFNMNPFLDRDGYHILVDVLRQPGMRQRARAQFARQLAGAREQTPDSSVLGRYAIFALLWSVLAAGFVIVFSLRYYKQLTALAPHGVVVAVFALLWALLFVPVFATLAMPLWSRLRYGAPEVNRVVA